MTTSRIDFANHFAKPRTIIVAVTIEGDPHVYTPAGVVPTSTAVTSGTVDTDWWPGAGALTYSLPGPLTVSPVADLLDPSVVWSITRKSDPLKGDTKVDALTFDMIDRAASTTVGAATAILSVRDSRMGQLLTADITAAAVSIPLRSITGIPTSGIACIGRESFVYDGSGGSSLTITAPPAGRGKFGSSARSHTYSAARPAVVSFGGPRYLRGRTALVWLCDLRGLVLYDPTVVYRGAVGPGVQRNTRNTRWSIPLDPATEALGRKLPRATVQIAGIHHPSGTQPGPLRFESLDGAGGNIYLSDTAATEPDAGGWHPSWPAFVASWTAKSITASCTARAEYAGTSLSIVFTPSGARGIESADCSFERQVHAVVDNVGAGTSIRWTSRETAPLVCASLQGKLFLALAGDIGVIPSTLSYTYGSGAAQGDARFTLSAKCRGGDFTAAINTRNASASIPFVTLSANIPSSVADRQQAILITEPQGAKLGIIASGTDAVSALRAAALAIDAAFGMVHSEGVDFDQIASAFRASPVSLPEARAILFGDGDTLLDRISHEARLRGFALCTRYGKVSVFRSAVFASTERVVATITEADILCEGAVPIEPVSVDGRQPEATSILFKLAGGLEYQWTDTTSQQEFGDGAVVACDALTYLPPEVILPPQVISQLGIVAAQLLGPLAEPYAIVKIVVGPRYLGVQEGDLVTFTHPRVPNYVGTLGVTGATCQVQDVSLALGSSARMALTLRMQSAYLAGYAPEAWLAGITSAAHAVCTIDTSTAWGAPCFAPDYTTSGAASTDATRGFAVGDAVVISQGDTESPAADESFTILAVDPVAGTITLDGTPTAPMRGYAGTMYGCLIRFDTYDQATAAQHAYLYVADHTAQTLGAGAAAADRWAA